MTSDEDFSRKADYAETQARSAKNELDRAAWLRVAQCWLSLLPRPPQSEEEAFDAETAAKGTGQEESKSSN
jgi:hypothetical protein